MSIEVNVKDYELLVRLDGSEVVGAHKRSLEVIEDTQTGQVFSTKELDATSVVLTEEEKEYLKNLVNK